MLTHTLKTLVRNPRLLTGPFLGAMITLLLLLGVFLRYQEKVFGQSGDFLKEFEQKEVFFLLSILGWLFYNYLTLFVMSMVTSGYFDVREGKEVDAKKDFLTAWRLKRKLVPLALVASLVGWILKIVERRKKIRYKLLKRIGKVGWGATSMVSIPRLVEDPTSKRVIRESMLFVKKKWGVMAVATLAAPFVAGAISLALGVFLVGTLNRISFFWAFLGFLLVVSFYLGVKTLLSGIYGAALYKSAQSKNEQFKNSSEKAQTGSQENTKRELEALDEKAFGLIKPSAFLDDFEDAEAEGFISKTEKESSTNTQPKAALKSRNWKKILKDGHF